MLPFNQFLVHTHIHATRLVQDELSGLIEEAENEVKVSDPKRK